MNRPAAAAVGPGMTDPPPPPAWDPDPSDAIVQVASCANETEAAVLSAALLDAGVPHRTVGGLLNSVSVDFRLGTEMKPALWTLARDADAARSVLEALRAEHAANRAGPRDE